MRIDVFVLLGCSLATDIAASAITELDKILFSHSPQYIPPLNIKAPSSAKYLRPKASDPVSDMTRIWSDPKFASAYQTWYHKKGHADIDWDHPENLPHWNSLSNHEKTIVAFTTVKERWSTAPLLHQEYYIAHANWDLLTVDQQFLSVLDRVGLKDTFTTTSELDNALRINYREIEKKVRPHIFDGGRFDLSPQTLWWLSHVPPKYLRPSEQSLLKKFAGMQGTPEWDRYIDTTKILRDIDVKLDGWNNVFQGITRKEKSRILSIQFSTRSNIEKQWTIYQTTWMHLTDEQKYWSMLKELGFDTSLTEKDPLPLIVAPASLKRIDSPETPQEVLYISKLPLEQRTKSQIEMVSAFDQSHFDSWPEKKNWKFKEYNEKGKAWLIDQKLGNPKPNLSKQQTDWIRVQPFDRSSGLMKNWMINNLKWKEMSEDFQFLSFKERFLVNQQMNLESFGLSLKDDFAAMKAIVQPRLDLLNKYGKETPQQLFWIERIPESLRTEYEAGFYNNYGYGFFDGWTSYAPNTPWPIRSISDKAFRANPDRKAEALFKRTFKKKMVDVFGQTEFKSIRMINFQSWVISFYYRNYQVLTIKQKIWGLDYLSTLKSEEGKRAFHGLTIEMVLDAKFNGEAIAARKALASDVVE